jgi:uncharacterized protein (TIGR03083 family)
VEAVRAGIADAMSVFESLTAEEWAAPSGCEGWRVQDVAAHMSSNFKATADPARPSDEPLPALPAERLMDMLVEPRKSWSAEQVLDELRTYAQPLVDTLAQLQEPPVASAPLTVADLGTYEMHELADAYAFDVYCHLHVDVLAPRGPIVRQVPAPDQLRVRPAFGWMLSGLPHMHGDAFAFVDRPFGLELTGVGGGRWSLAPGDGRLVVSPGPAGEEAAVVRSDAQAFVVWGTKRADWREHVTIDGDVGLAEHFLDTLNIV